MKINFHRSSCIHIWLAAGLKPDLFLSINHMIQLPYDSFAIKILQLFLISNKTVLLINSFANQIWDKYQLLDLNQRLFAYQANTLTAELSWYIQDSFLRIWKRSTAELSPIIRPENGIRTRDLLPPKAIFLLYESLKIWGWIWTTDKCY